MKDIFLLDVSQSVMGEVFGVVERLPAKGAEELLLALMNMGRYMR